MRRALVLVLALGAGCLSASLEADPGGGGDLDPGAGGAAPACASDADCELAGASCCECPSFAVAVTSGWGGSCDDVECPPVDGTCPALVARCDRGACAAACAPVACGLTCADGFAVDAGGCARCACAAGPVAARCQDDGDCARVPADCCGCARGGADTAVPVAEVGGHLDGLACPPAPTCPEVSTCDPGATVRCLAGGCALADADAPPPSLPAGACGRADLPVCPAGTTCTLNVDPDATRLGVGVCRP